MASQNDTQWRLEGPQYGNIILVGADWDKTQGGFHSYIRYGEHNN